MMATQAEANPGGGVLAGAAMRILIIEDDADLAEALVAFLRRRGLVAAVARTLDQARKMLAAEAFGALILDLGLPDGDGALLVEELRRDANPVPVIVLTARGAVADRIHGLSIGADDYLPKPFDLDELHARLLAILRRQAGVAGPAAQIGNVVVDHAAREALVDGRTAGMTKREYDLFELLASRPSRSVSKQQAEQALFGANGPNEANATEVTMSRLRRRLEEAGAAVEILTVRGIGYVLRPKPV